MNALLTVVLAVQMITALVMIGLILVQHGKGADMGAAFGSGALAVFLAPAGVPIFCPERLRCWLPFSLLPP